MKTTAVALSLDGSAAAWAHIGDSRSTTSPAALWSM